MTIAPVTPHYRLKIMSGSPLTDIIVGTEDELIDVQKGTFSKVLPGRKYLVQFGWGHDSRFYIYLDADKDVEVADLRLYHGNAGAYLNVKKSPPSPPIPSLRGPVKSVGVAYRNGYWNLEYQTFNYDGSIPLRDDKGKHLQDRGRVAFVQMQAEKWIKENEPAWAKTLGMPT